MSEPMTEHKVLVTAGTYYGEPWIFLTCDCGWRLGFASTVDPTELATAAAAHPGRARSATEQFKETAEDLNTAGSVQVDVNGSEPMTEAEQAAAAVMHAEIEAEGVITTADPEGFDRTVRAIVAKLRPILAAEALEAAVERLNDQADRVRAKFGSQPRGHNRSYGLSEAASMLRADAAALRTTTSEETR